MFQDLSTLSKKDNNVFMRKIEVDMLKRFYTLAMDRDLWEMRMGYLLWSKWLIIHLKPEETDQYICIKRTTINPLTPKSD